MFDSIAAILPDKNKEAVGAAILSSMPAEGDTSVSCITRALTAHGLMHKTVNGRKKNCFAIAPTTRA